MYIYLEFSRRAVAALILISSTSSPPRGVLDLARTSWEIPHISSFLATIFTLLQLQPHSPMERHEIAVVRGGRGAELGGGWSRAGARQQ